MEFEQVVRSRRMVRNFSDRPLPPTTVERLLTNARRGPSAGFTQGTELLVFDGPDQTARYWDVSLPPEERPDFRWPGLLRAPLLILPFASRPAYADRYSQPDKRQADHGIRATQAGPAGPYHLVDTSFAAMLILLTAVDEGLGALFFGVFRPAAVAAAFGVPDGYEPIGAIAVGYPDPAGDRPSASLRRGRRPADEVIHRGRW